MPSAAQRLAAAVLEGVAERLWGFRPHLMRAIVAQRGALSALGWFVSNMPRYERTLARLGPLRTHLASIDVSLHNGCPYCVQGHAYALELHYLRERGALFPLSKEALAALTAEAPELRGARLDQALRQADLDETLPMLERMRALRAGAAPASDLDRRLAHLEAMFSVLNGCGIRDRTAPDEAHDPINKDAALRERLEAMRRAAA